VALKFVPFALQQVTGNYPGQIVLCLCTICEYKEFKAMVIVTVTEKPTQCVLFVQILEEVDLNSSPASCKSPIRPVSKLSALKS
jgi:hypothetical protein